MSNEFYMIFVKIKEAYFIVVYKLTFNETFFTIYLSDLTLSITTKHDHFQHFST